VATKQNIVARCGSSIPTPLAMPPIVTDLPFTSTRSAASLGRVSVVMMASAAARPPWGESAFTTLGRADRTRSIGSGTPITPVAAISTCVGGMRSRSATVFVISRASLSPRSPVQTFAQPLEARIACAAPLRACSMETSTGAPLTWFDVNTAAERAGVGEWIRARSFFPLGLMPAATPPAWIPGTAVIPPSSQSISAIALRGTPGRPRARYARSTRRGR